MAQAIFPKEVQFAMAPTPQTPEQQKAEQQRQEQEKKAREAAQKAEQERKEREQSQRNKSAGSRPAGSVVSAGAASTSNSAGQLAPQPDPRGDRFFTMDEIKSLAGDIVPGEVGWLKLNEEGTPEGAADMDYPMIEGGSEESYARVVGAPTHKYDEIVTPSGAPVTRFMNPDPVLWDAGMLARNPIPKENLPKREDKLPFGAPVVNQPVTT